MALDETGRLLLIAVFLLLGLERLIELRINKRNTDWLRDQGARFHRPDGFGLILVGQMLLIVLIPLEATWAPWSGIGIWTWPLLALALGAQALRYWVIRTLGQRWSIRVITLPQKPRILSGPYRWLRHPNYVAVAAETLVLPLAFGAWMSAVALVVVMGTALARRIRLEDKALRENVDAAATRPAASG